MAGAWGGYGNPLIAISGFISTTNIDTTTRTGFYRINSNASVAPYVDHGVLVVYNLSGWIVQEATNIPYTSGAVLTKYIRTKHDDSDWSAWKKII